MEPVHRLADHVAVTSVGGDILLRDLRSGQTFRLASAPAGVLVSPDGSVTAPPEVAKTLVELDLLVAPPH